MDKKQKRIVLIIGLVALAIALALLLPKVQQPVERGMDKVEKELTPPDASEEKKTVTVIKEVAVPGSINASDDVKSYDAYQLFAMLKKRDDGTAHKYSKGATIRAATGAEFEEFLAALKDAKGNTGYAKAVNAVSTTFWNSDDPQKRKIGAGFMVTRNGGADHCYALVLVMTGSKPALAAINALSDDPGKDWFVWSEENTPGEAFIVTLTSG